MYSAIEGLAIGSFLAFWLTSLFAIIISETSQGNRDKFLLQCVKTEALEICIRKWDND
jgi:hypothetical protein